MAGAAPEPVFLEVVDTGATSGGEGLMPDEVRLNGVPLAVAEGTPIVLHEVAVRPGQLVTATLTLVVSALSVRPAGPPPGRKPRPPLLG
ncbi:hypothetical protein [Blastococcus sp. CCUG 61487]|uniref:hypothetical protein n=1 Tax=Blastococcus sp. CCUG 61487 TaxID=1840703 RepID=UPI0010BF8B34|nr:hypothetical protein [Blastococcus sp. CCUG 61487]TKJ25222.1 hypothetical protein A6V29_04155 [Blastococcus sp. CCUG 61487]